VARRVEQFGVEVAALVGELPAQLRKILEVVGDGQFDVHVRANELEGLVGRVERLGNRVAMTILAAAMIDGLTELTAHGQRPSRRLMFGAGVGAVASFGAYTAWRRSTFGSLLGKLRAQETAEDPPIDRTLR
jgi:ubiquinone biosynthesis protein